MPSIPRIGSLEINQDLDFLRKAWTVQRVGWLMMVLLVVAALAGLLGSGPLSEVTASAAGDQLRIEYQRFARYSASTELHLALGPAAARDGEYRVWLSRALLQHLRIETITPPPERVEIGAGRLTYIFTAGDTAGVTDVTFYVEPGQFGQLRGDVGLPDGPTLALDMFVYP
ncbi:MAG: hypothetical protein IT340_14535 [Chloroflexi bacterium]|nr:hypothetical protein [Chloroflexota bacterium]